MPRPSWLARAALLCAHSACPDPEQATVVTLRVEYPDSWALDSFDVKARGKAFEVEARHELELRFPREWAGEEVEIVVQGYLDESVVARGKVKVVPHEEKQVAATVVLAWLGVEPPDLDAGPVDGAGDASPRPDAGVDGAEPDTAVPDTAVPDTAQPCDACPSGGSCNEAGLCVEEDAHGVRWVSIPAGSFEMGCSVGDTDCSDDELPRHSVEVSAFEMMETEVTQGQYLEVIGENPSYFSSGGAGADCGLDCPVEQIDWHEARAYCEAIGGRLPSEAEWEYAARAGTSTRYSCGGDEACVDAVAWYDANSGESTHPAATKDANAFGLYDMHGNVWEWVEDCWHDDYRGAPATGEVWSGGDCSYRVRRGGSWVIDSGNQHVSNRSWLTPGFRFSFLGVRCVR